MPETRDENYQKVNCALNITIVENLKALLRIKGISQRNFCDLLNKDKVSITRSHFNQIINHPEKNTVSVTLLLACCDVLKVPVEELVSNDFNPNNYMEVSTIYGKEYLNIQESLQCYEQYQVEKEHNEYLEKTSRGFLNFSENSALILNPSNVHFKGYIQDYYCYYYPTHSSGNRGKINIICGMLNLTAEDNYCKAILTVDTKTFDNNGNINYKKYKGYAVISTTVKSLHCIMYSEEIGEYCFLMFRHFNLNYGKQDCRLAEVLTSSSANEDRQPTVLRMLLSREEIKKDDLEEVAPSFALNYSNIAITDTALLEAAKKFRIEQEIRETLSSRKTLEPIFLYKEKELETLLSSYLKNKEQVSQFLMCLRGLSLAYHYNKVSKKADDDVRDILISKGYYKRS